ncbi:MAG: hypothetical protein AB8B81_08670 [Halioglobus sp.]
MAFLASATQAAETVQALRYGVTLFHFYQQDYFESLTELMTAQELEQLESHSENAELLRGGMSLSYGMDLEAQRIFERMLSEPRETVDRDRAWFYLAKLAWQRGDTERASSALQQMSSDYDGSFADEANYLRAAISLRSGNEDGAALYRELLPEDSPWRGYVYYNTAAARAAQGDWDGAINQFEKLEQLPASLVETKALRDKAFTASGFARMAGGDMALATEDFRRVTLNSSQADRAMLGYGWALSELGDYRAALSPWKALSERSVIGESARESLLAIPYAYEQLGKHGLALENYRYAADVYTRELSTVKQLVEEFKTGDLPALLELGEDETGEWLTGGDILPVGQYAPYLQHLISRHSFQLAMRELRDLHRAAGYLVGARERLEVLAQVDSDQRQSWATVMEGDRSQKLQQRHEILQAKTKKLREEFERAKANGDERWFANDERVALWNRVENATRLAETLGVDHADTLRLYKGALIWQDSEDYPERTWQIGQQLLQLEEAEKASRALLQNVSQAMASRSENAFTPRIAELVRRVETQHGRAELAIRESESQIRTIAVAELEHQSNQLAKALGQSRLAMAKLYDRGSAEVFR